MLDWRSEDSDSLLLAPSSTPTGDKSIVPPVPIPGLGGLPPLPAAPLGE